MYCVAAFFFTATAMTLLAVLFSDDSSSLSFNSDSNQCLLERIQFLTPLNYTLALKLFAFNSSRWRKDVKNLAVIIPIHPPKFFHGIDVLSVHATQVDEENSWDLIFVFSSREDEADFAALATDWQGTYSALVEPPEFEDSFTISSKKYYGILLAYPCYDFLLVADAEIIVTNPLELASVVSGIFERGVVFQARISSAAVCNCFSTGDVCNPTNTRFYRTLILGTIEYLPSEMRPAAFEAADNCNLYPWFSDIPVYSSSDIPSFFNDIDFPGRLPWKQPMVFDHLVYQMWKLALGEWNGVDLSVSDVGEGYYSFPEFQLDASKLIAWRNAFPPGPMWAPYSLCQKHPSLCTPEEGTHVIYHVDRIPWWRSVTEKRLDMGPYNY